MEVISGTGAQPGIALHQEARIVLRQEDNVDPPLYNPYTTREEQQKEPPEGRTWLQHAFGKVSQKSLFACQP